MSFAEDFERRLRERQVEREIAPRVDAAILPDPQKTLLDMISLSMDNLQAVVLEVAEENGCERSLALKIASEVAVKMMSPLRGLLSE